MRLNPHLQFDGRCQEAFEFYAVCLGGRISFIMSYGETPEGDKVQPEWRKKIIHATVIVGDYMLQGADIPPVSYEKPRGFSVNLNIEDAQKAKKIFQALAECGTVEIAFQQTFWTQGFGMLTDRYGIPWMITVGIQNS